MNSLERFQKPSSLYVLDSVFQIKWIVPLVWHCAPLQLWHVQLKNHIPINNWIVVMGVIRLSNVWWSQFQFFSILPKYGLRQEQKKSENGYNSVIIFYWVTFTSSYWKGSLDQRFSVPSVSQLDLQPDVCQVLSVMISSWSVVYWFNPQPMRKDHSITGTTIFANEIENFYLVNRIVIINKIVCDQHLLVPFEEWENWCF